MCGKNVDFTVLSTIIEFVLFLDYVLAHWRYSWNVNFVLNKSANKC